MSDAQSDGVTVTAHAARRIRERLGSDKADRVAARALTAGVPVTALIGHGTRVGTWLAFKAVKSCNRDKDLRLYGDTVFVFDGNCLITVLPVPANLRAEINRAREALTGA